MRLPIPPPGHVSLAAMRKTAIIACPNGLSTDFARSLRGGARKGRMPDLSCSSIAAGAIQMRTIAAGDERANFLSAGSSPSPEKLLSVRTCRTAPTRECRRWAPRGCPLAWRHHAHRVVVCRCRARGTCKRTHLHRDHFCYYCGNAFYGIVKKGVSDV